MIVNQHFGWLCWGKPRSRQRCRFCLCQPCHHPPGSEVLPSPTDMWFLSPSVPFSPSLSAGRSPSASTETYRWVTILTKYTEIHLKQALNSEIFNICVIIIIIYPLTMRVLRAPQMISLQVPSKFLCSPLPSWTWQTPGLSIPWCCLLTMYSSLEEVEKNMCIHLFTNHDKRELCKGTRHKWNQDPYIDWLKS